MAEQAPTNPPQPGRIEMSPEALVAARVGVFSHLDGSDKDRTARAIDIVEKLRADFDNMIPGDGDIQPV